MTLKDSNVIGGSDSEEAPFLENVNL